MITKLAEKVWKITAGSNAYFLDFEEKILIDTGMRAKALVLKQFLSKVVDFKNIQKVIFTHLHYDHIGNFDLFRNASFFSSKKAISCFKIDSLATVLDDEIAEKFKKIKLKPVKKIKGLEIIETPGHTSGSICIWYPEERILFSGDTLFKKGIGRTDLPNSVPKKMRESLSKLKKYNYKILCPGHG